MTFSTTQSESTDFVAPGGGAPSGEDVWFGNPHIDMTNKNKRLHLGCGTNKIFGFTNIDGDPSCRPDVTIDLSQSMPFDNGSIDIIYSEHLFEHFPLEMGVELMADCYRVLSDNGVMRIAMPDARDAVMGYLNKWANAEWVTWFPEVDTPVRALNMCFNEWGHQYLYDYEDLSLRLRSVGFTRVNPAPWGQSSWPELCGLESRKESVLIVEVQR